MERGWILATGGVGSLVDLAALQAVLRRHGVALERQAFIDGRAEEVGQALAPRRPALILLGCPFDPHDASLAATARALEIPLLVVGQSWLPGRLRLEEIAPGALGGQPQRFRRIWKERHFTLRESLVQSAFAELRPTLPDSLTGPGTGPILWRPRQPGRDLLAELGDSAGGAWEEAFQRSMRKRGRGTSPSEVAAVCVVGDHPDGWRALASGREVIVCGAAAYSHFGVTFDVEAPDALDAAIAAVLDRGERRNDRDRTRHLLATDVLFASPQATPEALDAAIVEAIDTFARPTPSVSIVINNFNYRDYLGEAIQSALDQTVPAHEVIVVDDGSTDGSAELVRATEGIVPVLKTNGGQGSAFNAGFARATGDVIMILDADDRLHPHAVERVGAAWKPGLSRLQFGLETIDAAGRSTGLYPGSRTNPDGDVFGLALARGIYPFMPTSGNAFSRAALERVMPVREERWRIKADLYLVLATPATGPVVHLPEVLGQYRVHGSNAHYHPLGREPYRLPQLLRDRMTAWDDLVGRLRAIAPDDGADLWRLRLHRRLCLARAEATGSTLGQRVKEGLRAIWLGATVRSVPLRLRLAHMALPFRVALARLRRRPHDFGSPYGMLPWPWPDAVKLDARSMGGPATWPKLDHGAVVGLTGAARSPRILGWGWGWPGRNGARLRQSRATIAFTLPGPPGHCRLDLDLGLDGPGAPIEIEVDCNGKPLDKQTLYKSQTLVLHIPDELLSRGHDGGLACGLEIRALPEPGRLHLSRLAISAMPFGPSRHAPYLPSRREVRISREEPGAALLGEGWNWPDANGAHMTAPEARLVFATGEAQGVIFLRLRLDCRTTEGHPIAPDLHVNGAPIEAHLSDDGRFVTAALDPASLADDGVVEVDIVAHEDPASGIWPAMRLSAIEIGNLDAPGLRRGVLLDKWHRIADIAEHPGIETKHLVPTSGVAARIAGRGFGLTFRPATERRDIRVTFFLAYLGPDEPMPVAGTLTVNGIPTKLLLGGMNQLSVPVYLAEGPAGEMLIDARFEADTDGHNMGLAWFSVGEVEAGAEPAVLDVEGDASALDAEAVFACVDDRTDWHPPSEGALWLASQRASLNLTCDADRRGALEITVLTLAEPKQRVTVELGEARAVAEEGGLQTLRLPLPPSSPEGRHRRFTLTLATDQLVSLEALGGEAGSSLVGGAILRVAYTDADCVTTADEALVSTPHAVDAGA